MLSVTPCSDIFKAAQVLNLSPADITDPVSHTNDDTAQRWPTHAAEQQPQKQAIDSFLLLLQEMTTSFTQLLRRFKKTDSSTETEYTLLWAQHLHIIHNIQTISLQSSGRIPL